MTRREFIEGVAVKMGEDPAVHVGKWRERVRRALGTTSEFDVWIANEMTPRDLELFAHVNAQTKEENEATRHAIMLRRAKQN